MDPTPLSVTITQPTQLAISVTSQTNPLCAGNSNGGITVSASGGSPGYQFSINGGAFQASPTFTGLPAGDYTVTVRDSRGCEQPSATITLTEPTALQIALDSQTNILGCFGDETGEIRATASGGTGPYTYSIDGTNFVANGGVFTNLRAGTYNVTARDANGCTVPLAPVTLTQPLQLSVSLQLQTNIAGCFGDSTGVVTVVAAGGTGAYEYQLGSGAFQASPTFSGLGAGTYSVTVRDANGCTAVLNNVTIVQPTQLTIALGGSQNPLCNGSTNGSITVAAGGGTGAYQYTLNGSAPQASGSFGGLSAGSYTIVVTDANGCTATLPAVTLTEPAVLTLAVSSQQDILGCFGDNTGQITVAATGGTTGYEYSINGGAFQTSAAFAGLRAGAYAITVRDANGCTATASATLTEPTLLTLSVQSQTDIAGCFGETTGSVTVAATGGTPAYQYSIDNGAFQASPAFTGLAAGGHTVTVRDDRGCTATVSFTLSQPTQLTASVASQTNVFCFGQNTGQITLSASGGTPGYEYSLNSGAFQTDPQFSSLPAGTYNIVVRDSRGCTVTVSNVNLTQPSVALALSAGTPQDVTCFGANDGAVTVTATGGAGSYLFSADGVNFVANGGNFTGLAPSTYAITVRDANGCTASVNNIVIDQPVALQLAATVTDATCNGGNNGAFTVVPTGGTPGFQYSIDGGNNFQASATFTGLTAGSYTVTVRDGRNCTTTLVVSVAQATALVLNASATDATCNGVTDGTASVTVSGGTAPYTYSWNTTPAQTAASISGLAAGSYTVTVTDANGCTQSASVTVGQPAAVTAPTAASPAPLCVGQLVPTLTATGTNIRWYSDAALTILVGSGSPFTPTIDNTVAGTNTFYATQTVGTCQSVATIVTVTYNPSPAVPTISGTLAICTGGNTTLTSSATTGNQWFLNGNPIAGATNATLTVSAAGDYTVQVTSSGCSATSAVASVVVANPAAPIANSPAPICVGGTVPTLTAMGSNIRWYSDASLSTLVGSGNSFAPTVNNTIAGTTTFYATQTVGTCESPATPVAVTVVAAPSAPVVSGTLAFCSGGTTVLTSSAASGNQWLLNGNPIAGATGQTLTVSAAGNYTVEVTAGGCSATSAVVMVTETSVTTPVVSGTLTFCAGGNTVLTSSAATGNQWLLDGNPIAGATAQTLTVTTAGNYSVQATSGGCAAVSAPVSVVASDLAAALIATSPTCSNPNSGEIAVNATGGRTPYEYSIDGTNFQSAATFTGLVAGDYTVSIRDAAGCVITRTQNITAPGGISIVLGPTSESGCNRTDGTIVVTPTGGTAPYQYFIDGVLNPAGSNNNVFVGLAPATYTIRVVDANGCEATASTRVATVCVCSVAATVSATNVTACAVTDGTITVTNPTGGSAPYAYSIDGINFQASATFTGLSTGGYTVTVRDATGCTFTAPVTVGTNCLNCTLVASLVTQTDPTCAGANNGVIAVTAAGGQGTVRYSVDNGVTFGTNPVFGGLAAGSYTVLVTDSAGCTINLRAVVLNAPPVLVASAVSVNPTSCGTADGILTITAIGGTAPYQYSIDGSNFQTSNSFASLAPGSYKVTVRDTNGCTTTVTQGLTAPNSIASVAVSTTAETACAASNGSITVVPTGGTAPYRYFINGTPNPAGANNNVFANLAPGNYTIRVETADNCPFVTTATVSTLCVPPCVLTVTATPTAVNCHNGNDGQIAVLATGGSGVYEYSIDGTNFQTAALFVSLSPGSYTVTVRDRNNVACQVTDNVTLANPAILTGSAIVTANPTCANNDGTVTVSASGGTGTLEYALNGGSYVANPIFSGLPVGSYTITVRDANGCTLTLSSVTLVPPTTITASVASTNPTSCTASDGSVTVSNAAGGAAPYEYSINNGTFQASATFAGIAPGSYTIVVRDRNNCTLTLPVVTVVAPTGITATATVVDETACRANDGRVAVTVAGGTTPYQYFINGVLNPAGANNNVFVGLSPATYTIRVVDANGCEFVLTATVGAFTCQPCAVVATVDSQTDPTCAAPNSGSVSVSATGGVIPYEYSLNGGAFQAAGNFTGLTVGTYSVVARDAAGCTDTVAVSISLPASIVATVTGNNPTACNRSNGTIAVTNPTGGTAPYRYSLDGSNFSNTTGSFTGLATGNYAVTIRDANGCEAFFPVALTTPGGIASATVVATNETACRANDGTITVSNIVGAAGPYRYFINGRGNPAGVNSNVFSGLTPGSYTILVIDANDCRYSAVVAVNAADCGPVCTLAATLAYADPNCSAPNSGSATVSATGGTAPYQYSVNGGAFAAGSGNFQNLTPGRYDIVVRDATGCQVTLPPIQLIAPQGPNDILTSVTAPAGCTAANAQIVATNVAGGTVPYQYSIDGTNFGADNTFRNLTAGVYTVYVRDAKQCLYSETVTIASPSGLTASVTVANETACRANDGRATVTVTDANGAVEYLINGVLNPAGANDSTFANLAPGNYSVLVRDASGCQFTVAVTVGAFACPPCTLTATADPTQPTCAAPNSGSIAVTLNNGATPYQFSVNGGAFAVGTGNFTGLVAGTYTIVVRDANGCDFTLPTVTLSVPTIVLTVSGTNLTGCTATDGVLTASATSGTAPYAYSLDGTNFANTTGTFTGLAAGNYTVYVRDANGCVANAAQSLIAPNGITAATLTPTNETACLAANGIVAVSGVTGGTAPYQYSLNGDTFQPSANFAGLTPGTYSVVVRDANGCTFTASVSVGTNCTQTCTVVASIGSQTNPPCALPNSGSVTISATGGAIPYQYSLNGGTFQSASNFGGLAAGTYSVVARDANGCADTVAVSIAAPTGISAIVLGAASESGCNQVDGSITVSGVTGGAAPYQYFIDGVLNPAGANNNTFVGLAPATYTIRVVDANGCELTDSIRVATTCTCTLVATVVGTDLTACGRTDGSLTVNGASGGTAPYEYSINGVNFQTNNVFAGLPAGAYTLTVRDAAGCVVTFTQTVAAPSGFTASVATVNETACRANDGRVTVNVAGGTAPFQYFINGALNPAGAGNNVFAGLAPGNYNLRVVDAVGCEFVLAATVGAFTCQPPVCTITAQAFANPVLCSGVSDGSAILVNITGGSGSYEFSIDNGATFQANPQFNNLAVGGYTILVRDRSQPTCTATFPVMVTTRFDVAGIIIVNQPRTCGETGRITFTNVFGGQAPYQFSVDGTTFTADSVFANLQPGRYRATIRDSRGCQFAADINVIGGQAIVATVNQGQAASCNRSDGSIVISNVSGGSGTFVYSLDGTNFGGTTTFANLAAGAYTVYIREQNGTCVATFPVTVTSTACCQLAVTPTATQPTGCSSTDGRIELAVTNGTAPFTYRLNNGAFQNNNVFSGLGNGGYSVTVRDASGCESLVTVSLAAPNALSAQTEQVTPASCFGRADGRVRVFNVTGGSNNVDNYEYSINGGTFQNSALFSGLRAGVYLLTVRDKSNGCVASYPVTVSEAAQIVATVTPTNPTACAVRDGRIAIGNVTGGVGPYEYSLDSLTGYQVTPQFSNLGNGTFRVYVRDSRGCLAVYPVRLGSPNAVNAGTPTLVNPTCQGSNNGEINMGTVTSGQAPYQFNLNGGPYQTTGNFTGLRAGTFIINVRDQTGCEYPFTYVLTEPATIVFEVRQTKDATCADPTGSVEVTGLLGGTPPYRYSLNGTDFQSSPVFENLEPNDYIMYVRDVSRNTCASSKPFTVRGTRGVTFEVTTSNIGCSNTERGSIIIHDIRGGIEVGSPVEYEISINGGRTFRPVAGDSVAFDGLEAGLYDIVIGYGANCRTASRRVTINAGSVPFDVTTTPATCGANNGSATAVIANPIPGKTYYYSIDSLNFFTTPNFVNLRAGSYRMYLRESINDVCSNIRTFVVAGPDSVRYDIQRDSCNKVVIANLRGGVAPYVVTLEGRENRTSGAIFANEFTLRNLSDGEYTLQVTDAAGCRTRPFNFRVGNRVTFKAKTTPSVIEEPTGGVLIYDITGGQPPYSVSVDGQRWAVVKDRSIPIDTLVTGLPVGSVFVYVRDANGCEQMTNVEIEELKFVVPNIFTPNGDGVNDTFFITKLPSGTFVKIIDRWGRLVYETRDYKNEWDGGTHPDGIYYYTIDIAGEKTYRGWVQIWR